MRAPSLHPSYADSHGDTGRGNSEKFPDFDAASAPANGQTPGSRRQNGYTNGFTDPSDRARRDSRVRWAPPADRQQQPHLGHGRQRSISNAIRHLRTGSMSQNAHEIADALRAPVSYKLIVRIPPFQVASCVAGPVC